MSDCSVANLAGDSRELSYGQSFIPNSPGPDGVAPPASTTAVTMQKITLGYPTYELATTVKCYVYDRWLPDPEQVGQSAGQVAQSDVFADGDELGPDTYTRAFEFTSIPLDATKKYYIYFELHQMLKIKGDVPYEGCDMLDAEGEPEYSLCIMFKVDMTAVST